MKEGKQRREEEMDQKVTKIWQDVQGSLCIMRLSSGGL